MNLTTKRKNLTDNIREVLAEKILCGELSPGKPLASNAELAREFGVSLLTADRAVRRLVSEGLVYREQGRGTYVSRNLPERPKKALRIGIADKLNFPIIPLREAALDIRPRTAMHYLKQSGCEVRILDYEEVRDPQIFKREAAELDGILFSAAYLDPKTEENLLSLSIPVVITLHEWVLDIPFHQTIAEHYPGMKQAAAEIAKRDFSEIIVIYKRHKNALCRRDSFVQALKAVGWEERRIRSIPVDVDWEFQNGVPSYRLAMKLSAELPGKLLFSTSDVISFAMMEAFRDAGLSVGTDFQLLSFDNLEDYGYVPFGKPVLTSIDLPNVRIAERSATLLLDKIRNRTDETTILRVPTSLIIRETAFS